jgi:hypothetical protein
LSVLKEKIAGMSEQQAEKLARELQEVWEQCVTPEYTIGFPVLGWLCHAIKLEGTVAEKIHLCSYCSKGRHEMHNIKFQDADGYSWFCKCRECTR